MNKQPAYINAKYITSLKSEIIHSKKECDFYITGMNEEEYQIELIDIARIAICKCIDGDIQFDGSAANFLQRLDEIKASLNNDINNR